MNEAASETRVRRRGPAGAIWAGFTLVTTAFVASLIWQVASVLFGPGATGEAASRAVPAGACREGLIAFRERIDGALALASKERDDAAAVRAFEDANAAEPVRWAQMATACQDVPHGTEASAALARLSRAAEAHVRRRSSVLAPVRREVDSFIRAGE